ncbi:MAG: hypothetical protein IT435_15950 [Phycisphaerales bacterium]|nr:hypothetical protein [Phycisphaerales bacterium]
MDADTSNGAMRGKVWGILMIGGAAKADDRGLSIHDTVRHYGYTRWFEQATRAAVMFKGKYDIGGFVIDRPFGNFGTQMLIDDRDRLLPLIETRKAVEDAIAAGIQEFVRQVGVWPWIYPGGVKSAYWQSLTSPQLHDRLMEYMRPFVGCGVALDDIDQDTALRAADILEMESFPVGYEPIDRAGGGWAFSTRRAFVTSTHLEQIESGSTYEDVDGGRRLIQWADVGMMNGPKTILVKAKTGQPEPKIAWVHDRLERGWDVALGCLNGTWRPGDSSKGMTAGEIDQVPIGTGVGAGVGGG